MACLTKTEEIDGIKYAVTQFPARQGLAIKARLLKVIGPVLSSISTGKIAETNLDLSALVEHLDDSNIVQLILDLLQYTKRNGKNIDETTFDVEFAGEYIQLYKVLWFVIRANGFFGKGDIGKLLMKLTPATGTIPPKE